LPLVSEKSPQLQMAATPNSLPGSRNYCRIETSQAAQPATVFNNRVSPKSPPFPLGKYGIVAFIRDGPPAPTASPAKPAPHIFSASLVETGHNCHYRALRDELIPLYYQRDKDGLPRGWIKRMKRTIRTLGWRFSADRMVMDYTQKGYIPAAGGTSSEIHPPC